MIKSFSDVIRQWPGGPAQFAIDVGVSANTANQMRKRNSIAPEYWTALAARAKRYGLSITEADLARLKAGTTKSPSQKKRQSSTLATA